MTTQTEPGAGMLLGALISACLDKILPADTPKTKPTRQQELRDRIEEETLHSRNGRSYHTGLLEAFGKEYSSREIEHAIHVLRRTRILDEHHDGPLDTAYAHANRVKQFFAALPYV